MGNFVNAKEENDRWQNIANELDKITACPVEKCPFLEKEPAEGDYKAWLYINGKWRKLIYYLDGSIKLDPSLK